jgi:hypothetical protein
MYGRWLIVGRLQWWRMALQMLPVCKKKILASKMPARLSDGEQKVPSKYRLHWQHLQTR